MKKIPVLSFVLFLSLSLFAQRQINDPNAEVREVKGYHAIKASHGIRVLLSQGTSEAVAVSATEPEYRKRIKTEVSNGVLRIYYDQEFLRELKGKNKKLTAYVSVVNLDKLEASSGASFIVENELKLTKLGIDASSGAMFKGKVNLNQLEVDQSSGSIIEISGFANNATIEGSSGSVFRGYDLVSDNCSAETSSGSNVQVTVNKELSVQASSGGNISYKGSGMIKNVRTSSGGNVSRKS